MLTKTKTEKISAEFRAAITGIKFQHGSSFSAFVDLSNGDEYLLTRLGQEVGKSSLYDTTYWKINKNEKHW
ncbi:MAG: hypothetical protein M0Q90_16990 [Bacteroidales bacterium]|nr:hypothetical protein [Bacteroidales bacterium]